MYLTSVTSDLAPSLTNLLVKFSKIFILLINFQPAMNDLPTYVSFTFSTCVIATFGFLYYAIIQASNKDSNIPVFVSTFIAVWIFLVSLLTFLGFFNEFQSRPPRLLLAMVIWIIAIIVLIFNPSSRRFMAKMPITTLTYIHIVRVPIEIVLWWLFMFGTIAKLMTFEGVNYDILSGISAPFAGLFFVGKKSKSNFAAIVWNILALILLVNIVLRATLVTPYFFNPATNDQPNIAVFYFPYILLPLFIAPVIFFSHIVSLYQLLSDKHKML